MIKYLLILIAVIFLLRILLNLLFGGFRIKIEKHFYHHHVNEGTPKPEGFTTIDKNTPAGKKQKYSDEAGEYVNYEEVK